MKYSLNITEILLSCFKSWDLEFIRGCFSEYVFPCTLVNSGAEFFVFFRNDIACVNSFRNDIACVNVFEIFGTDQSTIQEVNKESKTVSKYFMDYDIYCGKEGHLVQSICTLITRSQQRLQEVSRSLITRLKSELFASACILSNDHGNDETKNPKTALYQYAIIVKQCYAMS